MATALLVSVACASHQTARESDQASLEAIERWRAGFELTLPECPRDVQTPLRIQRVRERETTTGTRAFSGVGVFEGQPVGCGEGPLLIAYDGEPLRCTANCTSTSWSFVTRTPTAPRAFDIGDGWHEGELEDSLECEWGEHRARLRGLYLVEGVLRADHEHIDATRVCRLGWRPGTEHLPPPEVPFRPFREWLESRW